jgi:hypothetical protein
MAGNARERTIVTASRLRDFGTKAVGLTAR